MPLGPVELLVVKFPGNQFTGEIMPALAELVESGTIQVLDILFATKDADGQIEMVEIRDLVAGDTSFTPVLSDLTDILTEEDVQQLAAMLEPNSSAAVMLFENTWARRLTDALRNARAELLLEETIPRVVIEEVMKTAAAV